MNDLEIGAVRRLVREFLGDGRRWEVRIARDVRRVTVGEKGRVRAVLTGVTADNVVQKLEQCRCRLGL